MLNLPRDMAIDANLSIVSGPASFKAGLGSDLTLVGLSANGKNIAHWAGGWNVVGVSPITTGVLNEYEFSMGITGSLPRVIRWREGGDLNTVRATWSTAMPTLGMFSYAPDAIAAFDARFNNIRIRPFSFPEPTASVGDEQPIGARAHRRHCLRQCNRDRRHAPDLHRAAASGRAGHRDGHQPGWREQLTHRRAALRRTAAAPRLCADIAAQRPVRRRRA